MLLTQEILDFINKLESVQNYAKSKNISRQQAYNLIKNNDIDFVEIAGIKFIYNSNKTQRYYKTKY